MANIRFRKGVKANLPLLSIGEPGFATDTKELYVGDGISNILINSSGSGTSTVIISATAPSSPINGQGWIPTGQTSNLFIWNSAVSRWLSVHKNMFSFYRNGNTDGSYLGLGDPSLIQYYIPREGVISSIAAYAEGGNTTKLFHVQNNTTDITTFSFPGVLNYYAKNQNIIVPAGTLLRVYVDSAGSAVTNTIVQVNLAWSYLA